VIKCKNLKSKKGKSQVGHTLLQRSFTAPSTLPLGWLLSSKGLRLLETFPRCVLRTLQADLFSSPHPRPSVLDTLESERWLKSESRPLAQFVQIKFSHADSRGMRFRRIRTESAGDAAM
jgi:hypothetical protein